MWVKNPPAMKKTWVRSPSWEDPLEEGMQPTPVFLPENAYGQRSLAGYSPWGHKESDTTKQLSTAQSSYTEQDSLVNPKTAHNLLRDKEGPPD